MILSEPGYFRQNRKGSNREFVRTRCTSDKIRREADCNLSEPGITSDKIKRGSLEILSEPGMTSDKIEGNPWFCPNLAHFRQNQRKAS